MDQRLTLYTRINSKWIRGLSVKNKITQVLEEHNLKDYFSVEKFVCLKIQT